MSHIPGQTIQFSVWLTPNLERIWLTPTPNMSKLNCKLRKYGALLWAIPYFLPWLPRFSSLIRKSPHFTFISLHFQNAILHPLISEFGQVTESKKGWEVCQPLILFFRKSKSTFLFEKRGALLLSILSLRHILMSWNLLLPFQFCSFVLKTTVSATITKNLMLPLLYLSIFMLKNIIIGASEFYFDIPYLNRNVHATCKIMHENITDVSTCPRSPQPHLFWS